MSGWLSLLLVSLAISMDSVTVGLTYGLRHMRIPLTSLAVVAGCSFAVVYGVMWVGSTLVFWLSPEWGQQIGAFVLIGMGSFTLWRLISARSKTTDESKDSSVAEENSPALVSQFRMFGLIIQILKDPSHADTDRSGHIMGWEAVMLGLALSLDAFGAGISLTFLGYPPLSVAACIAVMSGGLLFVGIGLGRQAGRFKWLSRLTWFPPVLLICIGLVKSIT
ncbi:sporulation membrane protein YtaF [Brevibacillus ruminantium]|uniref:Sporulation membrane protein YtaF n=1 Tax=Brevibacillus ruminantium TaxID=2950604 RepID=A0ABY4WH93_9BACL|nr:sporulation membrane protein YtaF [Brevibacillus ruminantium]USG66234.1 sporulation membrane protein YtaF [Brevibacillus ruminantium]